MASFIYDSRQYMKAGFWKPAPPNVVDASETCIIRLLEWPSVYPFMDLSVQELLERRQKNLTVIFAPLDFHDPKIPERSRGLEALFRHFGIPTEFILERMQSVTHSFGSYIDNSQDYVCWAHSLCKNIELHLDENGDPFIRDPRGTRQNHGDWTWLRSGYFLRWRKPFAESLYHSNATLIIFSASLDLKTHLQGLAIKPDWRQGVMDPFSLLVVVAENMFLEISVTINKVLEVLRYTEHLVLQAAGGELTDQEFDFVGLHNISKHIIYLKEGTQAAVALVKHIRDGHHGLMANVSSPERLKLMRSVEELLLHKSSLLDGLVLRVTGMEDLVQNLINLAFNIVNQRDSTALKVDSRAMKLIATMTMVFLPTTTVAGVFGSNFFKLDDSTQMLGTAKDFHLLWAIAVPLTLVVLVWSTVWFPPSSGSIIRKQTTLPDRFHNSTSLAMPSLLAEITNSLRSISRLMGVKERVAIGPPFWKEKFSKWTQRRRVNGGLSSV